ncbi:MAG: ThiF family adenylyltransferase [Acidobacteriaceae bacterium]
MSKQLIDRSPDLKRLRDEGYDVEVDAVAHLVVRDIPYVNSSRVIKHGTLVSTLTLAGDVTTRPDGHVAYFRGDQPCAADGREIEQIKNTSRPPNGISANLTFSAKPTPSGFYEDYYDKVTAYIAILSGPAIALDSSVTAKTFPPIPTEDQDGSPFHYLDTASSRAQITSVTKKLENKKIAIVGLGGTGSYVLDLVAKTPVKEIHLFDGDGFLSHNAFRSPGAPSLEDLRGKPRKAAYFKAIYSKMHRGIVDHEDYATDANTELLREMDFVFLCVDNGPSRKLLVQKLEQFGISFIDVGMGIDLTDDELGGILRITASTPKQREHLRSRVSFAEADDREEYASNIQIADMNALNAALAVIKWKKLFGFYRDLEHEYTSTYTIDGNHLTNVDRLA